MKKIILAVSIAALSFSASAFDMEPYGITKAYVETLGYSNTTSTCALASIIGMKACGFNGFWIDMQKKGKKNAVLSVIKECSKYSNKQQERMTDIGVMYGTFPKTCPAR